MSIISQSQSLERKFDSSTTVANSQNSVIYFDGCKDRIYRWLCNSAPSFVQKLALTILYPLCQMRGLPEWAWAVTWTMPWTSYITSKLQPPSLLDPPPSLGRVLLVTIFIFSTIKLISSSSLNAFGFLRSVQKILDQPQSQLPKNIALLIHPTNDWNGVFHFERCKEKIEILSKKYQIRLFLVSSLDQMNEAIRKTHTGLKEGESIQLMVVSGHGSHDSITFGREKDAKNASLTLTSSLEEIPFHLLDPKATIILNSCSTGDKENCLAEKLSKFAKERMVYAPSEKCRSLQFFSDDKPPQFYSSFQFYHPFQNKRDITAVYQNGREINGRQK